MAYSTKKPIKGDKMSEMDIQTAFRQALQNSIGGPDSDVGLARLRNLEYYNAQPEGELAPPEIDDRSDFVATDVADTIEAMLPNLMRPFVSSDDAVEFEGRLPQDEDQAKMATAYINYLFYDRNDGVGILYDWFKDALLQKVGFVKVWAEEDFEEQEQSYEGQTQEQLVMLLQEGWQLKGEPTQDGEGGINFTVAKESSDMAIKVAACAPHEMRVDANARWGDEPALVAQVYKKRKYELEEEGVDLSGIGKGGIDSRWDTETLELLGPDGADDNYGVPHPSHELYNCAEVYMRLDADGDGIAEWICGHLVEQKLIEWEKCDGHPFVWACPIPRPHAFFGDCPADQAIAPQKARTNIMRAIFDNVTMSVNNRTYVNMSANVNLDDLIESRPNGLVRGDGPADNAIRPIEQPNLGAPAYELNEWLEGWKENRTGFTRYSQGMDADALNHTATGVSIITQKSDARMELISRHLAVGVKLMFAKLLKLAIKYQKKAQLIRINGQFVPMDPSEWRNQFDVKIKVGLGNGSKEQQSARIMGLMQAQQLGIPLGIVGPEQFAESLKLYVEANEFKNPERFVSPQPSGMPPNPQAYQAEKQQAMQQMQQMAGQLDQLHQQNQQLTTANANKQMEASLKQMEIEQRAQEADQKHQHAMASLGVKAQNDQTQNTLKAVTVAQGVHETYMGGIGQAHDMAHKDIDAQQNQKLQALQQQIDELKAQLGQSKESDDAA